MPDYEIDRWDSLVGEVFTYWFFMWILYGVMIVVFSLPLLSSKFRRSHPHYWQFSVLFPFSMWVVGAFFHALWSKFIWGHYYYSPDYVVDFLPFLPILRVQVESRFGDIQGKLLGETSMSQLRLIWFGFALPTWLGSWLLCRLMSQAIRKAIRHKEAQAAP